MAVHFQEYSGFIEYYNDEIPEVYVDKGKGSQKDRDVVYNRYKLHISMDEDHLKGLYAPLSKLLTDALQRKIICGYKVYNRELAIATGLNFSRSEGLPFTIYLHNEVNFENLKDIVELCKNIEKITKDIPAGNPASLAAADCLLFTHLTFRQTAIEEKEYIRAHDPRAKLLKTEGEKSVPFLFIKKGLLEPLFMQQAQRIVLNFFERKNVINRRKFVTELANILIKNGLTDLPDDFIASHMSIKRSWNLRFFCKIRNFIFNETKFEAALKIRVKPIKGLK